MARMLTLRYDRGTLLLDGVPATELPPGFVWDDRVGRPRAEARHYHELVLRLHRAGVPFEDQARRYNRLDTLEHQPRFPPRDYQAEAVTAWQAAGRRGIIALPTGAGKSFVAELAIADARRSTLVVAPTIDLVNQWHRVLTRAFGGEVGVLGGGQHAVHDLTVSTYDSAYLHIDRYGDRFGLIVFDEVHHLPSDAYAQIGALSLAPYRLGLSATPERPDGLHNRLPELVGSIVYTRGIRELAGGVLADYEVERLDVWLSDEEQRAYDEARRTYRGFVAAQRIHMASPQGWQRFLQVAARSKAGRAALRAHRDSRRIIQSAEAKLEALDELLDHHQGERTIVFTNDNATVYRISRLYGIPCITHETGGEERREILSRFEEGVYRAVVTSRVLNEGVDIPAAQVGIVLSGTSTVREHVQRLGRILRPKGGRRAILYEVVTGGTVEEQVSERRGQHDAYR